MMMNEILDIWRAQQHFIRFVDGNKSNCSITNLEWCKPAAAMRNINHWAVDWDMNLTAEQIEFVRLNHEEIALFLDTPPATPCRARRNRRSSRSEYVGGGGGGGGGGYGVLP